MNVERLTSCAQLTTEHAAQAARSAGAMRDLLAWAARVARPSEGAPKILMAIAQLARADWVEGMPYIEITGNESEAKINVFSDHGMGIRERVLPLARLRVPIDEFTRAVRLAPQLVSPFRAVQRGDVLILTPREITEVECEQPIKIDDSSLHEQERKTAPPPPAPAPPTHGAAATAAVAPATAPPPSVPDKSGIHTHPTVRRMVAVVPEALRSKTGGDDE